MNQERIRTGSLSKTVTLKVLSKLLNQTKSRTSGHVLSNNGLCNICLYAAYTHAQYMYVLLFLVLAVNSDRFQILQSYILLL